MTEAVECSCNRFTVYKDQRMYFDIPGSKFALLLTEIHSEWWCAVLNSGGGMFQLVRGNQ